MLLDVGGGGSTSQFSCSQSSNLQARMDGGQNKTAVDTAVCGMVTDGSWTNLLFMYMFAVNSTGNSVLNWISSSFSLTAVNGPIAFSANNGYTGVIASQQYFTTGFTPSINGMGQNSSSIGECTLTNRTTANSSVMALGTNIVAHWDYITPLTTATTAGADISGGTFPTFVLPVATAQGAQTISRTSGTNVSFYVNGSLISSPSDNSVSVPTQPFYVLALNNAGVAANWDGDQVAYVWGGIGMTSAQQLSIYNRLHAYLQAIGETTAC